VKRLLVISPLHNEAAHVRRLVASVAAQTRAPDLWLAVDDGSTDETPALLAELSASVPFMHVLSVPQRTHRPGLDRLAVALEARAFNSALRTVALEDFAYVGKLDGDIELEPNHFERLIEEFERDPRLGIVGSAISERRGSTWQVATTPPEFVHGAVKLYSLECFRAIGGIREQLGWDILDEAAARMRAFTTRSLPDLESRHHRQSGSAQGRLRGHARAGESAWIAHYPPHWIVLRSFKMAAKRPQGLSGAAFAVGSARAAARRVQRVNDDELRAFVRGELNRRLRRPLALRP
jgi:glycosyltransferase involved in cell wall biosynthesis